MSNEIKITFLNENKNTESNVVATFGFHLSVLDLYMTKAKIIKKKDGSYYVAPPSEKYTCSKTGETKYANFWWFGDRLSAHFQKKCQEVLSEYCKSKNIQDYFNQ